MIETLAATWWIWLGVSLLSFLAVAINAFLVTYGTALDIAELAYQATKLERKDLPPNPVKGNKEEWKEWGGKTLDVAKNHAVKRATGYAVERATRKIRKVFFSVILFGTGVITAVFFIVTTITSIALAVF